MSYLKYIDCDNNYESLLSLLKQTIVEDDITGNWYIRVVAADADETPVSVLTQVECGEDWNAIENLLKGLLVYNDSGELAWAVYNSE